MPTIAPAPSPSADVLAATYTASATLAELAEPGTGYRPSIRCRTGFGRGKRAANVRRLLTRLADAYDAHQAARGDPRRAWRC